MMSKSIDQMAVILPGELRKSGDDYPIVMPMEKLRTKYLSDRGASFASVDFDLFTAQRAALRNRVDGADLYATLLMNSSVKWVDVRDTMACVGEIERALARVPDISLRDADLATLAKPVRRLLASLMRRGFGIAKTFKLLSIKRPALFPMLDGLVLSALFDVSAVNVAAESSEALDLALEALVRFRTVLVDDRNRHLPALARTLSKEVARALRRERVPAPYPAFSEARIADNLLWFDWGGYENFSNAWRATPTAVLPRA